MSPRSRRVVLASALLAPAFCFAPSVFGYGYYRFGNGRADFNLRYDLVGNPYPGQANANIYNFGKFDGFTAAELGTLGLTAAQVNTAVANATNAWEAYLNLTIDDTTAPSGTGNVLRLGVDNTAATYGAYTWGYQHPHPGPNNYTEVKFYAQPANGVNWNPTNFEWNLKHEIGHVMGLRDLYPDFAGAPYAEDFVDHPLNRPETTVNDGNLAANDGRRDNLMDRYRFTNKD